MRLDILEVKDYGFMIMEDSRAACRAVVKVDEQGIARLTNQVGLGKLYKSKEAAENTLNNIKGIYCLSLEEVKQCTK